MQLRLRPILLMLLVTYGFAVATGFIHEFGHLLAAGVVGIPAGSFSPVDCLQLQCRVYTAGPLDGVSGTFVLAAGGGLAALIWAGLYVAVFRLRHSRFWWVGALAATLALGELTGGLLEGFWNDLYTRYVPVVLLITGIAGALGFFAHIRLAKISDRLHLFVASLHAQGRKC